MNTAPRPYGPLQGDTVELGDTGLRLQITNRVKDEHDEFRVGFAKSGRDGIGLRGVTTAESCDLVIANVIVLDPVDGVRVASIGIRQGRICGIGRAGNPDISEDVDLIVGTGTVVIDGDGLIATPGGIDTHVHSLSPRVFDAEISSGVTTVIGQEAGPMWGVGLGSPWVIGRALRAMDAFPVNIGLLGRGSSSNPDSIRESLLAHACGLKVHEDTGATLRTIDTALTVADDFDVQVALHTDGLNETLSVADTIAVTSGRAIHAFHVEGCGGGHAPDVLRLAGHDHILTSSTNPTLPYGVNAVEEHLDMIMFCHGMDADRASDVRIASARVRAATMAAESRLHDLGVIHMTSSDAQGMGRAGETWWRTFALAGVVAATDPGRRERTEADQDNERILRYLAKITINPALVHGISHEVGRLAPGMLADIVLWRPEMFAAKPWLVLKGGFPAWGVTGDPNASIDSAQPLVLAEQFGALGAAPSDLSFLISNDQAVAAAPAPMARRVVATSGCRAVRASSLIRHAPAGEVRVSPNGDMVTWNGQLLEIEPVRNTPLSRLHFW
ncbi:MAG: urease subunit alpha [Actinobacteria bacterium]|uniref:urease n=1 Tax=freshwater metagenome TaxID=449393 RepID=A0A6J7HZR3_9ZZZZ|nr:urease subunit alpha [Actinomycetota bacterium]